MRKLAIAVLIAALLFCAIAHDRDVHASTSVGGLIASNTVWTQTGSPYQLIGPVGVEAGVTLTIAPGAEVDFGTYFLEINGTLDAQGSSSSNIIFQIGSSTNTENTQEQIEFMPSSSGWNDAAASGSIIENAYASAMEVTVNGGSPKITRDTFNHSTLDVESGSPSITNNFFNYSSGLSSAVLDGSPTFTSNLIDGSGYQFGITAGDNASITDNVINKCYQGVQAQGAVTITGNTITNCLTDGISSTVGSTLIQQNYISGNAYGVSGVGIIEENTITGNKIGIQASGPLTIENNNIYGNTNSSIVLTSSNNVDASGNWWGTTDTSAIQSSIYDSTEDFTLGTVTYNPILTSPDSNAPANPIANLSTSTQPQNTSNPTNHPSTHPTPTPTQLQPNQHSGWLSSVGSQSSGPENSVESIILELGAVVAVALAVGWAIVFLVVAQRRLSRKRQR